MSSFKLLVEEIRYRKLNFALGLVAVTITATLFVAAPTLIEAFGRETDAQLRATEDETRKIMRDMGFNLLIVHRDTDMTDFWSQDFATVAMPQDYVQRLADSRELHLIQHLVAMLQEKIEWNGRSILLAGYLPETQKTHGKKKRPMGYDIEPGTALVGHELAADLEVGDTIEVQGRELEVADIWEERGSKEDITIAVHLDDAQEILGKEDRINQIVALGCRCSGERLPKVRSQLEDVLPETKITEYRSIAVARAEQRDLLTRDRNALQEKMETWSAYVIPALIIACGIFVGLLALGNVHDRRMEIGVLRALGKGSARIAALFITRAALLGLLGGLVGFLLGTWLARGLGSGLLDVSAEYVSANYLLLACAAIGTPLVCALAAWLPALIAVSQDPTLVLQDR